MPILDVNPNFAGEVGVIPRIVRIKTNDTYSEVIAADYLKGYPNWQNTFYENDSVLLSFGTNSASTKYFTLLYSGSNITLVPDIGSNLVTFDVTVGHAALASGGSVILVDSRGTEQYKIRSLQLNSGGTNFSGGGGDRLGQVTDETTVYSVIPAATLQTLANEQWGTTGLPNPASAAINTSTAAGADLVFKYSGGATDYTAGSLVISGIVQRVA